MWSICAARSCFRIAQAGKQARLDFLTTDILLHSKTLGPLASYFNPAKYGLTVLRRDAA